MHWLEPSRPMRTQQGKTTVACIKVLKRGYDGLTRLLEYQANMDLQIMLIHKVRRKKLLFLMTFSSSLNEMLHVKFFPKCVFLRL